MNARLWWYVSRSSGLVAWALLTASTLWGLALTTRAMARRAASRWLLDLHRFLGGLSLAFVAVHLGATVADSFVHFGLADVLVPLASAWHPVWVAWGIVGFYLLLAVEITSLLRRHLSHRLWRSVHAVSFVLFPVVTVHALLTGPDTYRWARWMVIVASMPVAFLAMTRTAPRETEPRPAVGEPRGSLR